MARRCPNCGERVPSNSITCPKCFKKLPVEPTPAPKEEKRESEARKMPWTPNMKVALALNLILGLFGIQGIGQLYCGRRRGFLFLLGGLLFFAAAIALLFIVPGISWFFSIPFFVIYAVIYLASLMDLLLGNIVMSLHT